MIGCAANPGDKIWIEFPTYDKFYTVFAEAHASVWHQRIPSSKSNEGSQLIGLIPTYPSLIDVCYLHRGNLIT